MSYSTGGRPSTRARTSASSEDDETITQEGLLGRRRVRRTTTTRTINKTGPSERPVRDGGLTDWCGVLGRDYTGGGPSGVSKAVLFTRVDTVTYYTDGEIIMCVKYVITNKRVDKGRGPIFEELQSMMRSM